MGLYLKIQGQPPLLWMKIELYQKLSEAEAESQSNESKISHKDLMTKMRAKINE